MDQIDSRVISGLCKMFSHRYKKEVNRDSYTVENINANTDILEFSDLGPSKCIIVMVTVESKVGKPHIEKLFSIMKTKNNNHAIIISRSPVNSYGIAAINGLSAQDIHIEVFEEKRLTFNIIDHTLSPKYRVCSDQEKQDIFKIYSINSKKLPRMSINDPAAKYYGLSKGTLVEITRKSRTTPGTTVSYRIIA
jgi:DNA-directed RNA polymerase I, II, and III subunit RPABC1